VQAALTMVVLIFLLATAIATAQERLVKMIQAHVGQVKRWGGWVLVAVGSWFILLGLFATDFARVFPV
jgi:cytochrome c biogenesis protein CcdA